MANFTQLKPEDVETKTIKTNEVDSSVPPVQLPSLLDQTSKFDPKHSTLVGGACKLKSDQLQSLEEEVLGKGTVTHPYLMRSDENSKSLKVKLGNFVDDDDFDDCDVSDEDCYQPSFCATSKPDSTLPKTEDNPPSEKPAEQPKLKKPEKLLTENTVDGRNPVDSSSQLSEQAAHVMASAALKTNQKSEENLLQLIGQDDDLSDTSDLEYDPELDLPNPGEIVEEKDGLVRDFVTKLNFSARPSNGEEQGFGQQSVMTNHNKMTGSSTLAQDEEIESFSLDNEFDYDNVILSPKYNTDEMAVILNAMKGTSQEQFQAVTH